MRKNGTLWTMLALLALASTVACGNEDDKEGGAGAAGTGGASSGGNEAGGTSSGGIATGGTSSGGAEEGGEGTGDPGSGGNEGGAGDGGRQSGGVSSGGVEEGGDGPGGTSTGGIEEGGEGPGGTATGGAGVGGADEGGAGATGTGGAETGGADTGGSETGGSETGGSETGGGETGGGETGGSETGGSGTGGGGSDPELGPPAGNPDGTCDIPAEAALEGVSSPDQVVGDGTPESCTSARVVAAVAAGGVITFDCGAEPVTIVMEETAVVSNDSERVVIDGGGLVTLSGGGVRRILYQNTCDRVVGWTTPRCDNQATPELTVQNLTFIDGNAKWSPDPSPAGTPAGNGVYAEYVGEEDVYGEEGGGAIYAQGGRIKIINSRFFGNVCADEGPDIGGAAVRAMQQYEGLPVYVVNSTFGGAEGYGNTGSNGGAIGSIGVSWTIINSVMSHNAAIGYRGNPADEGTPGGGSGGAIYNDGNTMTLSLCGTLIEQNTVRAYGSAIFFVSNDHSGRIVIDRSVITNNTGGGWEPTYPQISNHDDTPIEVTDSIIEQ